MANFFVYLFTFSSYFDICDKRSGETLLLDSDKAVYVMCCVEFLSVALEGQLPQPLPRESAAYPRLLDFATVPWTTLVQPTPLRLTLLTSTQQSG